MLKMRYYCRKLKKAAFFCMMSFTLICVLSLRVSKRKLRNAPLQLPYVVVHFDLKGAPPDLAYLESLLPQLRGAGVNALLMEYEDTFPYEGTLEILRSEEGYNAIELKNFLTKANLSGFEIIPLIQTFGHLEFALKHNDYIHLRENLAYADSLCPSKAGSLPFVREMVKQITEFHNAIAPLKHIHVGCDEVYHINTCSVCTARNFSDVEIFRSHVKAVCDIVTSLSPGTKTLIWDDMLRGNHPDLWKDLQLSVEPIAWHYQTNGVITHQDAYKYHKNFGSFWIATAFKGADGKSSTIPNLQTRFENHFIWMQFLRSYSSIFSSPSSAHGLFSIVTPKSERSQFRGIVLTGWSRYHHGAPICDLLPVSIPSLFANLYLIKALKTENEIDLTMSSNEVFKKVVGNKLKKFLKCDTAVDISSNFNNCEFKGNKLYTVVKNFSDLSYTKIDHYLHNMETELLTAEFANYSEVSKAKMTVYKPLNDLLKLCRELKDVMARYFTTSTIEEYATFMTQHMVNRLQRVNARLGYDKYSHYALC